MEERLTLFMIYQNSASVKSCTCRKRSLQNPSALIGSTCIVGMNLLDWYLVFIVYTNNDDKWSIHFISSFYILAINFNYQSFIPFTIHIEALTNLSLSAYADCPPADGWWCVVSIFHVIFVWPFVNSSQKYRFYLKSDRNDWWIKINLAPLTKRRTAF